MLSGDIAHQRVHASRFNLIACQAARCAQAIDERGSWMQLQAKAKTMPAPPKCANNRRKPWQLKILRTFGTLSE